MNAKEKAMEYLKKNLNLNYKQTLWLPHLEKAIDLAIQEAKKEVFDDIIKEKIVCNDKKCDAPCCVSFRKLKKKQLIGGKRK